MSDPVATICLVEHQPGCFSESSVHSHLTDCALPTVATAAAADFVREHREISIAVVREHLGYRGVVRVLKVARSDLLVVCTVRDRLGVESAKAAGAYDACIGTGSNLVDLLRRIMNKCRSTAP